MDRIVQSYMDSFLKSQDIVEKNQSKQFEMFSSYCAIEQMYSENFYPADVVIGDGDDCGIDAVAILVNGLLITSKEEIDDLLEINKKLSEINFVFVQAKTSSSFDYGDMGTFGAGVKDFFSDNPQMRRNETIIEKSKIVEYIFSKATYIKKKPACYLYYVTTGKWVDDQNCVGRMEIVKNDLLDLNIFEDVVYIPVGADLLQKYYRNTIDVIETEIEFSNKIL